MELNYKTFGQGPPLVILHGLFGMLDNWQTLAKRFAEHFSVYIIDQRNHGKSPHSDEMSYPLMAEDLQQFLESQWMFKAHILGHSMGGKTAMQFALNYPNWVDRLVVVDILPNAGEGGHELIFDAMLGLDLNSISNRKEAEQALEVKISEYGIRQFLLKNLSRDKSTGGYRWKMNLQALHEHYKEILNALTGDSFDEDCLFIKGERSNYITSETWDEALVLFPNANLETINGAGHWVHADQPDELYEKVLKFLTT